MTAPSTAAPTAPTASAPVAPPADREAAKGSGWRSKAVTGLRANVERSLSELTVADLIKDGKVADAPRLNEHA